MRLLQRVTVLGALFGFLAPLAATNSAASADENVRHEILLVELEATGSQAAQVGVSYRQIRAMTRTYRWFSPYVEFGMVKGKRHAVDDLKASFLEYQEIPKGTLITLAMPVPRQLPAWQEPKPYTSVFGDCVVITVNDQDNVAVIKEAPKAGSSLNLVDLRDPENIGRVEVSVEISSDSVKSPGHTFLAECPPGDKRREPGTDGGFDVGAGVRASVSRFELSPGNDAKWKAFDDVAVIVDARPSANGPPLKQLDGLSDCIEANRIETEREKHQSKVRDVFVCKKSVFDSASGSLVLLTEDGTVAAVAARSSLSLHPTLVLRPEDQPDWTALVVPPELNPEDLEVFYKYQFSKGQRRLAMKKRGSNPPQLRVPRRALSGTFSIETRQGSRLAPFGPRIAWSGTGPLFFELANPRPRLGLEGGDIDAGAELCDVLPMNSRACDDFYRNLKLWGFGVEQAVEIVPDYAAPSKLRPQLAAVERRIDLDVSSIRWNQFRLDASTHRENPYSPAAEWILERADGGDGLTLSERGTIESYRLAAQLLKEDEETELVARSLGSRFAGYKPVRVTISKSELRERRNLLVQALVKPIEIQLVPSLIERFAPALEIEKRDGTVVRLIGEADRFGIVPNRVEVNGQADQTVRKLKVDAPEILTLRPLGVTGYRSTLLDGAALRRFLEATDEDNDDVTRCAALHDAIASSPRGVNVYVADGQEVALRWDNGGRWQISVPVLSDISTSFRADADAPREGLQIWSEGKWRDFKKSDACEAPTGLPSGTVYLLLDSDSLKWAGGPRQVVNPETGAGTMGPCPDIDRRLRKLLGCAESPAETAPGERRTSSNDSDLEAFRKLWSQYADRLRAVLVERGFTRVELLYVSADDMGRPQFDLQAAITSLHHKENAHAFRKFHEPLEKFGRTSGGVNRLDDPSPLALRQAFLNSAPKNFDPFSTVLLLVNPRGPAETTPLGNSVVAALRVVSGYLRPESPESNLVALVSQALRSEDGGKKQ